MGVPSRSSTFPYTPSNSVSAEGGSGVVNGYGLLCGRTGVSSTTSADNTEVVVTVGATVALSVGLAGAAQATKLSPINKPMGIKRISLCLFAFNFMILKQIPGSCRRFKLLDVFFAKICFTHARVLLHVKRRTLRDFDAKVENGDAFRDGHDEPHLMLDEENC